MQTKSVQILNSITQPDQQELDGLRDLLELSQPTQDGGRQRTLTIFAIAPEVSPDHPVVQHLKAQLGALPENFEFETFFYSDHSLYNVLYGLDGAAPLPSGSGRRVILAFGLEQLDTPRLIREMRQLNLGREVIFDRNLILIFWLNQASFLDEFRRYAPDFWDWRGKVMTFQTRSPLNPLLYSYLEWLIAENSYLKMGGVMQVNRQVDIFLDQIYVSLQAEWVEEQSRSVRERVATGERVRSSRVSSTSKTGEPDAPEIEQRDEPLLEMDAEPVGRQRITKIVDLAEAVREHGYSVILGDPGAGKTTLLRYLARHFAIANRENASTVLGGMQENLGQTRLPILFRIADYAERLAKQPDLSLVEYLKQFYRQWERKLEVPDESSDGDAIASLLLDKMEIGDCLLLLDGLDEVFDQANRVQVVQQINQLVAAYPANKFVITSRIAGYQKGGLDSRFKEFTITAMGEAQIKQFLQRWCLAIEVAQRPEAEANLHQRDAEREARKIVQAIATQPGVKRFAANPLLLTILALIHRNGTQMPQRRVELYDLAAKTLIEDWQLGRNIPYGARQRQLSLVEEEVTALLAPLAFRMHEEKPSGLVEQADVEAWLTPKMAELQGVDEPAALELVRQFLRKVRETTGLFVERAPGVYGFMHLTFEEYFAARNIADNEIDDILATISPYRNQARWNEPILLALGYLSRDQRRINRLVEQLFSNLAAYQPSIINREMRLKNASSAKPVLVWFAETEGEAQESDAVWQDLLFVGQVLAEVKVSPLFCRQQVEKLVLTYVGLDKSYGDDSTQQLLKRLRGIEAFNHQVLERLQRVAEDERLSEEQRNEALAAMLYVVCGEAGDVLIDHVIRIVDQLTPALFNEIRNLVEEMGAEMTPALERSLEDATLDAKHRQALEFITGLSYLRSDNYDRAIARLEPLLDQVDCNLDGYIRWVIAIAHENKENYDQGLQYYQQYSEKLQSFILWRHWGVCYRSHKQYEQSLKCFQQALAIIQQLNDRKAESNILWDIGKSYQAWEKYEEAILYHQQSRFLDEQLGRESDVATMCYWLADCYRDWGKYEQALKAGQQGLAIRQKLDDQLEVAGAYYRLGHIYKAWNKYKDAIANYKQSLYHYQQLNKIADVRNLYYWLSDSYKEWDKYEEALQYQQKSLGKCQELEDQKSIALAYYRLGRVYQAWGKYVEAIAHYEQSRDRYQQLDKETNVADLWYRIGDCYREWGKYAEALTAAQQNLALRQERDDQTGIADADYQLGRIYQAWGKYAEAIDYYQQSRDRYQQLDKEKDVANLWYWLGDCYREWSKYDLAIAAEQQDLAIHKKLGDQPKIALAYWQLGLTYQAWGKYSEAIDYYQQSRDRYQNLGLESEIAHKDWWIADCYQAWGKYDQAIAHYEQSRDRYQRLDKEKSVANLWYWMADCYREWGKYEQAFAAEQQDLAIRQKLADQPNIGDAYYQLGRIYQAWGKYEQAIAHYEQSHDRYQQLDKESNVANQWGWLADTYRDWGNYEQAIECRQQYLQLHQQLGNEANVAFSYCALGRIYQAWGKYDQAIAHYEQSRDRYQQLEKETDVANLWYNLADCYREWGKYAEALTAAQQDLALRQERDDQTRIALAYYQLGCIYQAWGKYEEAINYYQQSRDRYQRLEKETDVANLWYNLADCYREWGKYEQALECEQKDLELCQKLDLQADIAMSHYQFGRIYQAWGKYDEAITYHERSYHLDEALDLQQAVANRLSWLAHCYRDLKDYATAIDYYRRSAEHHQAVGNNESVAKRLRQLSNIQRQWAKSCSSDEAVALLHQAEENLQQAIQLDTAGDYRENLAYDQISLALLTAESLRSQTKDTAAIPDQSAQFEEFYTAGFDRFTELGQAIALDEEALDIARAYLEISPLENLDQAETLTRQSLQTFQEFNRHTLQANACKLLGEIYLKRVSQGQTEAVATAKQFLSDSLQLYRDLTLTQKAEEVEQLLQSLNGGASALPLPNSDEV